MSGCHHTPGLAHVRPGLPVPRLAQVDPVAELAEFELERVRGNFDDARVGAVARGIHPCPVPPFGYTRQRDENGKIIGSLRPDPITGPLVSELFARRAAGTPMRTSCGMLEQAGVHGAYGHERWTVRAVKSMTTA